jgi:hypothetical protein
MLGRLFIALTAAGLLIAPMVSLTYIHSLAYMLIAVSLFAAGLGSILAFATRAKSSDIFAITATYPAVLVVFVSRS